jgi:hypothetical protein
LTIPLAVSTHFRVYLSAGSVCLNLLQLIAVGLSIAETRRADPHRYHDRTAGYSEHFEHWSLLWLGTIPILVGFSPRSAEARGDLPLIAHWSIVATLIQSAELNDVELLAWMADVLKRIVSGQTKRHELHRLLPRNGKR